MSEEYKMQRIKEYLIFHIKDSKERRELLDYLDQLQQKENIIKEVREIFKDYGEKEDIVGYSMYNITGEMLLKLLEILDKEIKE